MVRWFNCGGGCRSDAFVVYRGTQMPLELRNQRSCKETVQKIGHGRRDVIHSSKLTKQLVQAASSFS
jgi:hypothetical protein